MALLEQWREMAYNETVGQQKLQQLWGAYFQEEKREPLRNLRTSMGYP